MTIDKKDLDKATVKRKMDSGVGTCGLFASVAEVDNKTGKLITQHSFFLAQNQLAIMRRPAENKRSAWKATNFDNHDDARVAFQAEIARLPAGRIVLLGGTPLLIELQVGDIEAIDKGLPPQARYLASQTLDREDKITDDWKIDTEILL